MKQMRRGCFKQIMLSGLILLLLTAFMGWVVFDLTSRASLEVLTGRLEASPHLEVEEKVRLSAQIETALKPRDDTEQASDPVTPRHIEEQVNAPAWMHEVEKFRVATHEQLRFESLYDVRDLLRSKPLHEFTPEEFEQVSAVAAVAGPNIREQLKRYAAYVPYPFRGDDGRVNFFIGIGSLSWQLPALLAVSLTTDQPEEAEQLARDFESVTWDLFGAESVYMLRIAMLARGNLLAFAELNLNAESATVRLFAQQLLADYTARPGVSDLKSSLRKALAAEAEFGLERFELVKQGAFEDDWRVLPYLDRVWVDAYQSPWMRGFYSNDMESFVNGYLAGLEAVEELGKKPLDGKPVYDALGLLSPLAAKELVMVRATIEKCSKHLEELTRLREKLESLEK
jgi:hypothetical protein